MGILTRKSKGTELTHAEMDKNLIILERMQKGAGYSNLDNNYTPIALTIPMSASAIVEEIASGRELIVSIDYSTVLDDKVETLKGDFRVIAGEVLIVEPVDTNYSNLEITISSEDAITTDFRIMMPYSTYSYGRTTKYFSSAVWYFSDEL